MTSLDKPTTEDTSADDARAVTEAALFEGMAPVLIVPEKGMPATDPRRIVVAWNQSREALVAARRAMPFLRRADSVQILVIDPPAHGPERSDPGGMLCQMLVRHGVRAEVMVLAKSLPRVSDVLARHVLETDAEDMQHRDHDPYFSAVHAAKDSGIALQLGREQGLPMALAAATKAQYDAMVSLGLGELDKSGISELTFKNRLPQAVRHSLSTP